MILTSCYILYLEEVFLNVEYCSKCSVMCYRYDYEEYVVEMNDYVNEYSFHDQLVISIACVEGVGK